MLCLCSGDMSRASLVLYFLTRIGLAANLPRRHAHQRMLTERVAYLSVGKFLQFLVADEQGIDIVVIERVAAVLQLVVVNHRDERGAARTCSLAQQEFRRPDVAGVVVDRVYFQILSITLAKRTIKRAKNQMNLSFSEREYLRA